MIEQNELFTLAEKWVNETNQNIFLTGKAGTGKTTFLKHIKSSTPKRSVILAPTGVAAINAGGSTIHSFFRLPFATFIPAYNETDIDNVLTPLNIFSRLRYNKQHIQLLRTVELIVIDEVSMVRADILDMIDLILKRFRFAGDLPFGGVQMLFIGDMHQLPPVVKDQDARILSEYYHSPYFFDSKVLRDHKPVMVQLNKVYRQQDSGFLDLLNELRHNELSEYNYQKLRAKVTSAPPDDERYITLTSHVAKADRINEQGMMKLPGIAEIFRANIEGDFPEFQYPAATELALKKDARVMFIKNDPEKKFYNGKIGTVTHIEKDAVWVRCDDDHKEIKVEPLSWDNVRYSLHKESGALEEDIIGKFWQMPLRLAWAVTIHKSQGLTFDHVVIDAEKAFAPGQVYVALSRCRSWEGIVLLSRIKPESLFTDVNIVQFSEQIWKAEKLQQTLPAYRHQFQSQTLTDAFDLTNWERYEQQTMRLLLEFETSFSSEANLFFRQLCNHLQRLAKVSRQFISQIADLNNHYILPEENDKLLKRVNEACQYFIRETQQNILVPLQQLPSPPDSALAATRMLQQMDTIRESAYVHQAVWKNIQEHFAVQQCLQTRTKALHQYTQQPALKWTKTSTTNTSNTTHTSEQQQLEQALRIWRNEKAEEQNVEVYRVISNRTIDGIVASQPRNHKALLSVPGIGNKKVKEYGLELLHIISRFYELAPEEELPQPRQKKTKDELSDTYKDTLVLVEAGMSVPDIAKARNLAETTIGGHIAKLITLGNLPAERFVSKEKQAAIIKILPEDVSEVSSLTPVKEKLGDEISWNELKWTLAEIRRQKEMSKA